MLHCMSLKEIVMCVCLTTVIQSRCQKSVVNPERHTWLN